MNETIRRAFEFLTGRRRAYLRVFDPGNRDAQAVLADLAKFCKATETVVPQPMDPHAMAYLAGRRDVFLRIQQHLRLDDETLWRLLDGRPLN